MTWLQLLILAIIQGLTEFLPISSSAHLILTSQLLGWEDQGPLIDLMAHFGSLFAVMLYFRDDVRKLILGGIDLMRFRRNKNSRMARNILLTLPPALIFAAFLRMGGFDIILRSPLIIAAASIFFGVVLWLADIWGERVRVTEELNWKDALMLGVAQALAFIPGTSRSGITMTAGRFLGMTRVESARFSMLMSLPVIGAGGLFAFYNLATEDNPGQFDLMAGLVVAIASFVAAYACIALFMQWVSKIGFFPFMLYRVILGLGLLYWIFAA